MSKGKLLVTSSKNRNEFKKEDTINCVSVKRIKKCNQKNLKNQNEKLINSRASQSSLYILWGRQAVNKILAEWIKA